MAGNQRPKRGSAKGLQWAGLLLLVLLAVRAHTSSSHKPDGIGWVSPSQDVITRFEQRYEAIGELLPAYGRVGYVSEVPPERLMEDFDGSAHFYLTRYTLVPLQLVNSVDEQYVVGAFRTAAAARKATEAHPLRLIADAGDGMMLFERVER